MTATVSYPAELPCFQLSPYSYEHFDTHQRTAFNSGHVRQRRKANGPVLFNVVAKYTDEELEAFEAWREYDLEDIAWFNAQLKTGSGVEDWVVQFVSKAGAKATGRGRWELGFQLLARKPRFIDQLALYETLYGVTETTGTRLQEIVKTWDT